MFKIRVEKIGSLNERDLEESTSASDAIETIYNFPDDKVIFEWDDIEFTAFLSGDISDSWLDIIRLMEDLKSDLKNIEMQFPSQSFWYFWELNECEKGVWEIESNRSSRKQKKIKVSKDIFRAEFQKLINIVEFDLDQQGYDKFKFRAYQNVKKNNTDQLLAWKKYPLPRGGNYYNHSLQDEFDVRVLFDFCQILEATIFAEGWDFLLSKYGLTGLFKIDEISGWFDTDSKEEWLESILYQALISGINLQSRNYGIYKEKTDTFETVEGKIEKIDWEGFKTQHLI